jgi:hypothetical protein
MRIFQQFFPFELLQVLHAQPDAVTLFRPSRSKRSAHISGSDNGNIHDADLMV